MTMNEMAQLLEKFDKYFKPEDMMGIPCIGEGCACSKHKKKDEKE